MAVFRIEKTRDYTVMSNHHLKNKNLTLKAKGLMSLLLSLPDNWVHIWKDTLCTVWSICYLVPVSEYQVAAISLQALTPW